MGFEPTIPSGERPYIYTLDSAATRIDMILEEFTFVTKLPCYLSWPLSSRSVEVRRNSECCSSRPRCWTSQSVACRKSLARNFKQEQMDVRVGRHTSGAPLGLVGAEAAPSETTATRNISQDIPQSSYIISFEHVT